MIEKVSAFLSMPAVGRLSAVRSLVEDVCQSLAIELSCVDGGTLATGTWEEEACKLIHRAELVIGVVAESSPDGKQSSENVKQELRWSLECRKDVVILLQEGLPLEDIVRPRGIAPPHISFSIADVGQIKRLVFSRLFEWREERMRLRHQNAPFAQHQFEMCMALDLQHEQWTQTISRELVFNCAPRGDPIVFGFENNVDDGPGRESGPELVEGWELTTSDCTIELTHHKEKEKEKDEQATGSEQATDSKPAMESKRRKGSVRFSGTQPKKGDRARFAIKWTSNRANPIWPKQTKKTYCVLEDEDTYECFDGIHLIHPTKVFRVSIEFPDGYYDQTPKLFDGTKLLDKTSGSCSHHVRVIVLDDAALSKLELLIAGAPRDQCTIVPMELALAEERRVTSFPTRGNKTTKFVLEVTNPLLHHAYGFAWKLPRKSGADPKSHVH